MIHILQYGRLAVHLAYLNLYRTGILGGCKFIYYQHYDLRDMFWCFLVKQYLFALR